MGTGGEKMERAGHVRENSSDFLVYLEGLAHRPVHQRSLPQTYSPREWDLLPSVPVVELVQGHCTSQVDLAVLGELVADIRRHYYRMLGITSRLTLSKDEKTVWKRAMQKLQRDGNLLELYEEHVSLAL